MDGMKRMAKYSIIPDKAGNRYRFFCEVSDAAVFTTEPLTAATPEQERNLAWEQEGKAHFNQCPRCGRFVCDTMYNADVCECVECAPWEEPPKFCRNCGGAIVEGSVFCPKCGIRARYGEVWTR